MPSRFAGNEEATIAELRAYWDSLLSSEADSNDQIGLDPDLAATVQQIHQQDDALTATPEFAARLLGQLMGVTRPVEAKAFASSAAPSQPHSPAPIVSAARSKRASARAGVSRAWAVISAGSVVLILLAIGAGIFIWNSNQEPAPAVIPLRTESTADGVLIRTLLEEHVPAGALPGNPTKWIASFKFSLEPGEAWRDRPIPCDMSRQYVVGLVESGTLAMINTGPFEVTRSDGTKESIPAGVRADVHAGDSWVYLSDRTETNVQKWNPGSVPMVAYQTDWALDASCESTPSNPEWIWHQSTFGAAFDPARPLVVSIEQAFVQPGATLSQDDAARIGFAADESEIFRVIGIESGTLEEAWVPEALMQAEMIGDDAQHRATFEPGVAWSQLMGSPPEGQERAFAAGGEEPLVLASISWSYDDAVESAAGQDSAPTDGIERTSLLDHHFAADGVSRTDDIVFVMNRAVVPPGESIAYPASCGVPVLLATAVEAGAYSVQAESAVAVTRTDGSQETLNPDSALDLIAGDSFIYANTTGESLSNFRNTGSDPLVILQAIWFPEPNCTFGTPGSEDRAQITWLTYDRLPGLVTPMAFELNIQSLTIPSYMALTDEEILGFSVPESPADNLARLAIESGEVLDQIFLVTGNIQEQIFSEQYGMAEVLSLDDPLALGDNFERDLMTVGGELVELTVFSITYERPESM